MKTLAKIALSLSLMLAASMGLALADASVYVVHGVPGVNVDVYVNGDGPVLENFEFSTIEGPLSLPAGTYDIDIYAAGADPATSDPAIARTVGLVDGQTVSLVAHLTEEGGLALTPFGLDPSAPGRATSRLSLRHTAAAPPVDLIVRSPARFNDRQVVIGLTNGAGATSAAPAGPAQVTIALPGTTAPVVPQIDLVLEPGKVYAVYAVGSLANESFTVLAQVIEPVLEGMEDDFKRDARRSRRSFDQSKF